MISCWGETADGRWVGFKEQSEDIRRGEEFVTIGGIDIEEDGGDATAALVEPRQKK